MNMIKKVVKGLFKWFKAAIIESIAQVFTILGFFIAWLTLTGTAQQVVGVATLISIALWLITIPLREEKEQYNVNMKIRHILLSCILILGLSGCGYDGHYRYPCQDPANWDKAECNVPICETTGTCTRDIIGKDTWDEYQKTKGK